MCAIRSENVECWSIGKISAFRINKQVKMSERASEQWYKWRGVPCTHTISTERANKQSWDIVLQIMY
jgi:hypothetical protein